MKRDTQSLHSLLPQKGRHLYILAFVSYNLAFNTFLVSWLVIYHSCQITFQFSYEEHERVFCNYEVIESVGPLV